MSLPLEVTSRFATIFPDLKIKDFSIRTTEESATFIVDGVYEKFKDLHHNDKPYFLRDTEKYLKTAMKGWELNRLNFATDGSVKIIYKKRGRK